MGASSLMFLILPTAHRRCQIRLRKSAAVELFEPQSGIFDTYSSALNISWDSGYSVHICAHLWIFQFSLQCSQYLSAYPPAIICSPYLSIFLCKYPSFAFALEYLVANSTSSISLNLVEIQSKINHSNSATSASVPNPVQLF